MKFFKKRYLLLIIGLALLFEAGLTMLDVSLVQAEKQESTIMVKIHAQETEPLATEIYEHAKTTNNHLNVFYNETLFNTKLLRNPAKTGLHLAASQEAGNKSAGHSAVDCTVKTSDGASIATTFINHNSDTLLIIGAGFSYDRRSLASFACYEPDIVLFQPRGSGVDHQPATLKGKLSHKLMGVDSSVCRLGSVEEHDVIAVTEYYKKQKKYNQVIYLGICYSAVIGAKAAALHPDLFDKLILDGSWPSLKVLIGRVIEKPILLRNPQSTNNYTSFLTSNRIWTNSSIACTQKLFNFKIEEAIEGSSIFPHLHKPILFFQGLNDVMVPTSDFEEVWNMVGSTQKVAVYTPSRHIQAHIKHKELYHMLCHLFIKHDFATFAKAIKDQEKLKELSS